MFLCVAYKVYDLTKFVHVSLSKQLMTASVLSRGSVKYKIFSSTQVKSWPYQREFSFFKFISVKILRRSYQCDKYVKRVFIQVYQCEVQFIKKITLPRLSEVGLPRLLEVRVTWNINILANKYKLMWTYRSSSKPAKVTYALWLAYYRVHDLRALWHLGPSSFSSVAPELCLKIWIFDSRGMSTMVPRRFVGRVTLIHCMVVLLLACSLAICCGVVFGFEGLSGSDGRRTIQTRVKELEINAHWYESTLLY